MKTLFTIAIVILAVTAGCQNNDEGTNPNTTASPYSGTFDIDYFSIQTNCGLDVPPGNPAIISIEASTITFGDAVGTWILADKRGFGTGSIGDNCLNYNPPIVCATCIFIDFDIIYASPDSFSGTYAHALTYGNCGADSCHTVYFITGKRVASSAVAARGDFAPWPKIRSAEWMSTKRQP